jgi:hypothetical protein
MVYVKQRLWGYELKDMVLPLELLEKEVDVIVLPVDEVKTDVKRKRILQFMDLPPLPDSFFEPISEEDLQEWGL